jgi:hypothetical protein
MTGEYGIEICSLINAEHPTGKIKFLWNKPKKAVIEKGDIF